MYIYLIYIYIYKYVYINLLTPRSTNKEGIIQVEATGPRQLH